MKKNNSGFSHIVLLILIVVLGVGILGYNAYNDEQIRKFGQNTTQLSKETSDNNRASEWSTYNFNGITFKYPPNWKVDKQNTTVYAPGNEGLVVLTSESSYPIEGLDCYEYIETINLHSFGAQKYRQKYVENVNDKCWGSGMGDSTIIFISEPNALKNTYKVRYLYSKQDEEKAMKVFDQILSTVRFSQK